MTHSLSIKEYQSMYKASVEQPDVFWAEQAERFIDWNKKWQQVCSGSLAEHNVRWFVGGELNACYNCLDRHLSRRAQQTAIIWEGDNPDHSRQLTYAELHKEVCRLANLLKKLGIQKGDRVCIYLPTIPEAVISMLACARIGAVHSVVFGGFSAAALESRIKDAECKILITADQTQRRGKNIELKATTDEALKNCPSVQHVIVVKHIGADINWDEKRDVWYHEAVAECSDDCPVVQMQATDPLFILYTSGSTGKPKGILHSVGGYMVYAAMTFKYIFDYQDGDIYWCTADVGWITGHSYIVYGPLAMGATEVIFSGVPIYPDASRYWQVVDKHQVNIFYTAPTAIRALISFGDDWVKKSSRQSLKLLGSVGEPINPDVWNWYYETVGDSRCPIVDTWWQTETGGIMISPLPGTTSLKPGSASWPFFGVVPGVVNERGELLEGEAYGDLVFTKPWPGQLQTIYGDQQRFIDTYFTTYPGYYFAGDGVRRDEDGYYWITGRVDDVINVSGHRLGTEEIESALVSHPKVAEAAVVDCPHEIKGQGIYAFITPMLGVNTDDALKTELENWVRKEIGSIAKPDHIQWAPELPKTRSGKIMRRILRKIVHHETEDLGDISTLANPEVVKDLLSASN